MVRELTRDAAVDRYMAEVNQHQLLTREQETDLAERYRTHGDLEAARQLVVANLRFVVRVAHEYRGYNMNLLDLIQEGNIGLMLAVRRFDPRRGFRLISYAIWWIRAEIFNFILRSWSLVKLSTGRVRRMLFFKLRWARAIADHNAADGTVAPASQLAEQFAVAESEIRAMEDRLAGRDASLNAPLEEDSNETWLDLLSAADVSQEERMLAVEESQRIHGSVAKAMGGFTERERYIVQNRLMADEAMTLLEIGKHFQVSRERARQIEDSVLRKIRLALVRAGGLERTSA